MYVKRAWSSCKLPVILVRFKLHLNFLNRFWKIFQIFNSMKIRSVEAELFHSDRRTDGMRIDGQQT
jgi:hypothetical protein